jgi:GTPase Era involved in 16S rRNA processing
MNIVLYDGSIYYYHDIIFQEELRPVAKEIIKEKDCLEIVKHTLPISIENFIKFFREKYRLCWKEIYLKFKALVCAPE